MNTIIDFQLIVGMTVGKILFGALFGSRMFRSLALGFAAAAIFILYYQEGIGGILLVANKLRADMASRPDFAKGMGLGAVIAFIVFGALRKSSRQ